MDEISIEGVTILLLPMYIFHDIEIYAIEG